MQLTGKWCDGELCLEHALQETQVVPAGTVLVTPALENSALGWLPVLQIKGQTFLDYSERLSKCGRGHLS